MKLFKRFLLLLTLFFCYTFVSAFSYARDVSADIANSVFRLHIIANSDTEEDQNLKLLVRDDVLKYMKQISKDVSNKEDVVTLMYEHLDEFQRIAKETIKNNGYDYEVRVKIGKFEFPTKEYGDIALPAGMYDALRIEIGKAEGHNWWCVMFPTLCFVDVSSGELGEESKGVLESSLNEEEYDLVSGDNLGVNFKFKIIEFFEDIKVSLANR